MASYNSLSSSTAGCLKVPYGTKWYCSSAWHRVISCSIIRCVLEIKWLLVQRVTLSSPTDSWERLQQTNEWMNYLSYHIVSHGTIYLCLFKEHLKCQILHLVFLSPLRRSFTAFSLGPDSHEDKRFEMK